MFELYLELKAFLNIISFVLMVTFIIVIFLFALYKDWQFKRKIKYLTSIGFTRYLHEVASIGDKRWYGWQRNNYSDQITESSLEKMTLKDLKKTYKVERTSNE